MRCTLGSLYCRRNLGIRGREQPRDLLGQRLIRGEAGKLALPEIEIAPGQPVELTSGIVVSRCHVPIIDDRHTNWCSQAQSVPCRTAASALM
jgi:hypothetical protein